VRGSRRRQHLQDRVAALQEKREGGGRIDFDLEEGRKKGTLKKKGLVPNVAELYDISLTKRMGEECSLVSESGLKVQGTEKKVKGRKTRLSKKALQLGSVRRGAVRTRN